MSRERDPNKPPTLTEILGDLAVAQQRAKDFMMIMTAIAYAQPDKMFSVSIEELKALPLGSYCDVSFNKTEHRWEFTWGVPPAEEQQSLIVT